MFADFLPLNVKQLSEDASIAIAQKIQRQPILTPLSPELIPTTYLRFGNGGTPILLLHGFDSSVFEFRRLLPLLGSHHETWAVDLLGFGFTERGTNLRFSPVEIKTHLFSFWETVIQQPVILVGASMGGAAAIDFTLTYPQAVSKLVLLDSAGLFKQPSIGRFMIPPLDSLATAFLKNSRIRQSISQAAYWDKKLANADALLCTALHLQSPSWSQALIAFTKSGGYGSFAEQLPALKQPTLILWGSDDKILGTKDAYKFEQLIPNSQLIWIQNCGHVPHLEQPSQTAQSILQFCASSLAH